MNFKSTDITRVYLALTLLNTLAASMIWGINTIFLLDAGLTNLQAFAANAFFTVGQVIFEIPTGIIADTLGRRTSYLLGTLTLSISTLLYLLAWETQAPFAFWAITSILLGLGFTFFSGATEAWLVDGLAFTKSKSKLEDVMAKGQIIGGIAMLSGSVAGGVIAQFTSLGVPYVVRAVVLGINALIAFIFMKDLGFTPTGSKHWAHDVRQILNNSIKHGLGNPPVRWMMLAAPFTAGVGFYAFYAMQPHLLELYGNSEAYSIAGLTAAIIAGAQILGGLSVPFFRKLFKDRTTLIFMNTLISITLLVVIGFIPNFWITICILVLWGLVSAATSPVRQAYMNNLIPSQQRATVLSFDSLISSSGGIPIQPILGKVADSSSYATSFMVGGCIQLLALPFILLAKKEKSKV